MHLKRLEIFGFKSFAQRTVLEFQPGISVIVGPNGCGKSNVFDAVRWVLGEQSIKELRGSAMEDVIFNGTDLKSPLGFAEVSLFFSNPTRFLPLDHDEVIVTRRLFRSGESEYLLNKNICRLKDVVELFLGTGIGAEAYSLIQQGKVDLIVSARPDDRRQIFDEAAGITKYKSKKKEALAKLQETQDNLLRINDIVVEVKRQIASIERQAKKAQRYKEEFAVLKHYEWRLARHQMTGLQQEYEKLSEEGARLQAQETQEAAALEGLKTSLDEKEHALQEIEKRIHEGHAKHIHLDNEVDVCGRQIAFNQERLQNMAQAFLRLDADKAAGLKRCAAHQGKIEEIKEALRHLAEGAAGLQAAGQRKREELAILMHGLDGAKKSIAQVEAEILGLHTEGVRLKNQLTENMKRVMESAAKKTRLELESSKIDHEKSEVLDRQESVGSAMAALKAEWHQVSCDAKGHRQALEELEKEHLAQEAFINDLEKTHVFLVSQKEFIQKMNLQYQDIPDAIVEGTFTAASCPREKQTGIIGKVKNVRLIPATKDKPPLYEMIYETKYVALDVQHLDERIAAIVAKSETAHALKAKINGRIQETTRVVEETLKTIQDQEKRLSVLEAQKNDFDQTCGKLMTEKDVITAEFKEAESLLVSLRLQENEMVFHLQGIDGQIQRCKEDIQSKEEAILAKSKEREVLNVSMAQLETELDAMMDKRQGLEENLELHIQNLDQDLADMARFDEEGRGIETKKVKIHEENLGHEKTIQNLQEQKKLLDVVLNEEALKKEQMALHLNSLKEDIRRIEDEINRIKKDAHNQKMRQQEVQFNQRTIKERFLQLYKINWDETPCESEAPPSAESVSQQGQDGVALTPEGLCAEIEKLKKRCESYGAVNLVAIEEHEELKTRYEFLTKQQSDLLTAREGLLSTIQKINRTTRQMFTDTFTKVNEEFKMHFRMLFGGGEAQLVLLDPDNALECGIDIVARPPGKKLQNISLLSGGEKALTAIALIFGVFKVNPSPFCVLDEIDAALDESNVDRFTDLLKEFAKIAQFIVITHNKNTMAVADIMYGVTMQERGVSRIVSVKFDEYKPLLAPSEADLKAIPAAVSIPAAV